MVHSVDSTYLKFEYPPTVQSIQYLMWDMVSLSSIRKILNSSAPLTPHAVYTGPLTTIQDCCAHTICQTVDNVVQESVYYSDCTALQK